MSSSVTVDTGKAVVTYEKQTDDDRPLTTRSVTLKRTRRRERRACSVLLYTSHVEIICYTRIELWSLRRCPQ